VATCTGILVHQSVYRYPCFHCPRKFAGKRESANHMALKHDFVVKNLQKMCFECKEEVDDPVKHAKIHNCKFSCSKCGFRFLTQEKLDKHTKERHENADRPFVCNQCELSFKTLGNLKAHEGSVHTAQDEKFNCDICDRCYPTRFALKKHNQVVHSEVRR
jgi:ribosomal protein L31